MGMTISFVGSVLFLPAMDVSINMISMFGFLMVLGIVVDDIVVENIYEYRERGIFMDAAIQGARDIAGPVTQHSDQYCRLLPLLFIPGTTGKFWWPLGIVIIQAGYFPAGGPVRLPTWPIAVGEVSPSMAGCCTGSSGFSPQAEAVVNGVTGRCWIWRYAPHHPTASVTIMLVCGAYAMSAHMGVIRCRNLADEIEANVRLPVGTTRQAEELAMAITEDTRRLSRSITWMPMLKASRPTCAASAPLMSSWCCVLKRNGPCPSVTLSSCGATSWADSRA